MSDEKWVDLFGIAPDFTEPSSVPAGAGGVDQDDLVTSARKRAAELMDNLRETQGWRDGATMLALASELRALLAALAAAEQRADTLAAALAALCTCPASSMFNGPSAHCPTHGSALSSRPPDMDGNHISIPGPVQPDTERSET